MSKKIFITGGAGFVGSSLALQIKSNYPAYEVIVMDNLKRKGSELNIKRLTERDIIFIHGDIRNKEDFDAVPSGITDLIEASAEPSVLAGIQGTPDYLINTNLLGTINCLNFAKKNQANFIFLSTSRVYPIKHIEDIQFQEEETRFTIAENQTLSGISAQGISEKFPLDGYRSLYGATKLASELIIQEYNYFYNLPTVINRCGVITGPWQMGKVDQGVIVLWLAKHYWKQQLSYIGYGGKGKQVRDILHINDLYRLIDLQMHNMQLAEGKILNVGGGGEVSVSLQELTSLCQQVTGNNIDIQQIPENRKADIRIYITDNTEVTNITGWKPEVKVEEIIEDIYKWIHSNHQQLDYVLK